MPPEDSVRFNFPALSEEQIERILLQNPGAIFDTVRELDPLSNEPIFTEALLRREAMPATIADRIKAIREKDLIVHNYKSPEGLDVSLNLPYEVKDNDILETLALMADETGRQIIVLDMMNKDFEAKVIEAKGKYKFPLFLFTPDPHLVNLYKESSTVYNGEYNDNFDFKVLAVQTDVFINEKKDLIFNKLKSQPEYRVTIYTNHGDKITARLYPDYVLMYVCPLIDTDYQGTRGNFHLLTMIRETYLYYAEQYGIYGEKASKAFIRKQSEGYIGFVLNTQAALKNNVENAIKGKQMDMQSQYRAIVRLERELQDLGASLRSIIAKNSKFNKVFLSHDIVFNNFVNLITPDGYKKFEFAGSDLIAHTQEISLESHGKKYKIGEFRIVIRLDGSITFKNMTNRKGSQDTYYDHPHVKNEIACLGNIKEYVPRMLNEGEYIDLLALLLNYLKSYANGYETSEAPWCKVERYWGLPSDYCPDCDRASLACKCLKCPSCNHRPQSCTCELKCLSCHYSYALCAQQHNCHRCENCLKIFIFGRVEECICTDRCKICRRLDHEGHRDFCGECEYCHERVNWDNHDVDECMESHQESETSDVDETGQVSELTE